MEQIYGLAIPLDIANKIGKIVDEKFIISKNNKNIIFGEKRKNKLDDFVSIDKCVKDLDENEISKLLGALRVLASMRIHKKLLLYIDKRTGIVYYLKDLLSMSMDTIDAYEMVDMKTIADEKDYMIVEITDFVFLDLAEKELIKLFS